VEVIELGVMLVVPRLLVTRMLIPLLKLVPVMVTLVAVADTMTPAGDMELIVVLFSLLGLLDAPPPPQAATPNSSKTKQAVFNAPEMEASAVRSIVAGRVSVRILVFKS
jgi:hypothetical protein